MTDYMVAMTTLGNREQVRPIVAALLEEGLAACIQEVPINSHYVWRGEVCEESEVLLLLKTRAAVSDRLRERLIELHPYDTPELIEVPVTGGHAPYLRWIDDGTS